MIFIGIRKDMLAATVVLLSVCVELALREMYYRMASEIPHLTGIAVLWVLLIGFTCWSGKLFEGRWQDATGRLAVVAACVAWTEFVAKPVLGWAALSGHWHEILRWSPVVLLLLSICVSLWLKQRYWDLVRRAVAVAAFVFVASQPVLAAWRTHPLVWPGPHQPGERALRAEKSVIVFLLLDELNANAAQPIADTLRMTGREVRQKALEPVGDGTAKVVPAMFARRSFEDAKPCGLYTVCSGSNVLDFSKVVASRPDVDVIGFYMPYCSIQGLRWCARFSPASPVLQGQRWWCAAMRRYSWIATWAGSAKESECAALGGRVWSDMVSGIERAFWQAPVWREGGLLFAHIPLPHPPGQGGDGSLGTHYSANLDRANALVIKIVERLAQTPKVAFTIVVFSDHPLRQSVWCQSSTQYRQKGCPLGPELLDDKVPLIVAGDIPAGFDSMVSNRDVFSLAGE